MDPLSQAVVAGVAGQNVSKAKNIRVAGVVAFLSGMLADLDILIGSSTDPLLALEYHRHFTHALIFIPIGGLLAASLLYFFVRKKLSFKLTFIYCTAGYATHALLDACTSYGTQLLWPFSDMRVAWNVIAIIDPIFTLTLLLLIVVAHFTRKKVFSRVALVFGLSYIMLGIVQNQRAVATGVELALSRGHEPGRIEAKASMGNMIVWKIIYEHEDRFYVDAARVAFSTKVIEGESVEKLDIERDFPWLDITSQQALDIGRFAWFSDDFLSVDKYDKNIVVDMRYSMLPNRADALWGIKLSPEAARTGHVDYVSMRQKGNRSEALAQLWKMVIEGKD